MAPEEHGDAGEHRDAGRREDRQRDLLEDRARLGQQRADLDHRARREAAHEIAQQAAGERPWGQLDSRGKVVRRVGQRVGREHQHVVEAHRVPVDPPQAGDPRLALAAEQADRQVVADFEPGGPRQLGVDRDQRLARIVFGPPFAGDQRIAFGQALGISQPALAAQRPGARRAVRPVR
jgi:hypothetical protein